MSALLEQVLSGANMVRAFRRVCARKGRGEIPVGAVKAYIRDNWEEIREKVRARSYTPPPVPDRTREGTEPPEAVMDQVLQQALVQVIRPLCEKEFTVRTDGFRPAGTSHAAIASLLLHLNEGYLWVIDIGLDRFFETAPQDHLMTLVRRHINDRDTESLVRKYLKAGILRQGRQEKERRGELEPEGLPALLTDILLHELDKELERRELCYTRHGNECLIAVRRETTARRTMEAIAEWTEQNLGIKVNRDTTRISRAEDLTWLGTGFYRDVEEETWKSHRREQPLRPPWEFEDMEGT